MKCHRRERSRNTVAVMSWSVAELGGVMEVMTVQTRKYCVEG
jgi:hypothetical protein